MVKCVTIGWRGDAGERADVLKGTRVSVRENGWRRGDGMGAGFRTVVRIFSDKTNWQPYDRAVIFSDTGERPKKFAEKIRTSGW